MPTTTPVNGTIACVWDMTPVTKRRAREIFLTLTPSITISNVQRIIQRNGIVRFQVTVSDFPTFYRALTMNGLYVRPYYKRRHNPIGRPITPDHINHINYKIMSININGLTNKKEEILQAARDVNAHIILCQETLQRPDDWKTSFFGWQAVSVPQDLKGRGLAIFARQSLPKFWVIDAASEYIFIKFPSFIVGTCYISPNARQMLSSLRSIFVKAAHLAESYKCQLILGGDMNVSKSVLATIVPPTLKIHQLQGGSYKYSFERGNSMSLIDFFISSNEYTRPSHVHLNDLNRDNLELRTIFANKPTRIERFNISDHNIIHTDISSVKSPPTIIRPSFKFTEAATKNSFDALADLLDISPTPYDTFVNGIKAVSEVRVKKIRKVNIPRSLRRLIRSKRNLRDRRAIRSINKKIRKLIKATRDKRFEELVASAKGSNMHKVVRTLAGKSGNAACVDPETYSSFLQELAQPGTCPDEHLRVKPHRNEDALNARITLREIETAVKKLDPRKACGPDGITNRMIIQLNKMCPRLLEKLLNRIFNEGVSNEINRNFTIPIYKKQGDARKAENCRPISLMNCSLKLLTAILASRLDKYVESNQMLAQEQCGFRRKQECPALIATVLEVANRVKGLYVAFIDLSKAFDSVVHTKLLAKLQVYGVKGKFLSFLSSYYSSIQIQVPGAMSSFACKRGVRQGCPLSPILFDIYINDVFKNLATSEILSGAHGLMYADDILLWAKSLDRLNDRIREVDKWCVNNGMAINRAKCGVFQFGPHNTIDPELVHLGLPVVEAYKYLGLRLTPKDTVENIAKYKQTRLQNKIYGFISILRSNIPLHIKRQVYMSYIIGEANYGSSLLGGTLFTSRIQSTLDLAIRAMVSTPKDRSYSALCLAKELKLESFSKRALRARIKLYVKLRYLKRMYHPRTAPYAIFKLPNYGFSYVTKSRKLHEKFEEGDKSIWKDVDKKEQKRMNSKSLEKYLEYNLDKSCLRRITADTEILHKIRAGGFLGAYRLAGRLIERKYRDKCPCCNQNTAETLVHMMLYCPRWAEFRSPLEEQLDSMSGLDDECKVYRLLGGTTNELDRSLLHRKWFSMGGFQDVLGYLRQVMSQRNAIIARLKQTFGSELDAQSEVWDPPDMVDDG
jgi:hypothetical protein